MPSTPDAVSLHAHLEALLVERDARYDQRFNDQQKAVEAALAAAKEVTAVAETNAVAWRENANEWRGAMSDRERNLFSRKEGEELARQIQALSASLIRGEGNTQGREGRRTDGARSMSLMIAAFSGFIAFAALIVAVVATSHG